MRVSYNWLKKYLDIDWDVEEMARRYTLAGLEYDEIWEFGNDFSNVVVAKVLTCDPVEGSDHLHICKVDIGEAEPLDIICGAPNCRPGLVTACAKVGAELPGGFTITARKTFGHMSNGMLCSQEELGVSTENTGIWELNDAFAGKEVPLGADIRDALDLRDEVILIELTPNRSDCMGMINLAREAAAYNGREVKYPDLAYAEDGDPIEGQVSIEVADHQLCPRYTARLVKGVKIGPSPLWMQNYLRAAGMRPINNVVDISNFVMLEMNQPLHTFDYDQLHDKKIVVRAAEPGEKMVTLDEKEREFKGGEILICDGQGPVCVAGVMGGMNSEVTENTTNILIESASFEPVHIRRAARSLGIPSEASMRFEKGVDTAGCDEAARRAAQLLVKYCGGTAAKGNIDVNDGIPQPLRIDLRAERVNHILGTDFTIAEIDETMEALGFGLEKTDDAAAVVTVPTYRQDISAEVDLIEEVARLKGYTLIPRTLPLNPTVGGRSREKEFLRKLKTACAEAGLNETINYSFISPAEGDNMLLPAEHEWRRVLPISNPLSEDQSVMRRSLIPGLLHCAARNQARRNLDLRFFEMGMVYIPAAKDMLNVQPEEIDTLAMLVSGAPEANWLDQGREYDFFTLKGVLQQVMDEMGVDITFGRTVRPFLHPGRAAALLLDGEEIGFIGEIHPKAAENYQLSGRVIAAEITLPKVVARALAQENKNHELPKYPASTRDIAVIGRTDIAESDVAALIRKAGGEFLRGVRLFDIYDKPPIPEGCRSLAYGLEFRSDERTLKDKEVDAAFAAIVEALDKELGYKLR